MSGNKEQTYLQLAPEFGSTKFGPFLGVEIRLGSDPAANDITLPEAYGIAPEHVKILIQPDGSFIIAPTQRSATVYAFRGQGRPKQVTSPMAVGPGDSIALATPEGPRFYLLRERPQQAGDDIETPQDAIDAARRGLNAGGVWEEMKRVGVAKVVTSNAGHFLQQAWTFIKSGSFLKPRYIVMGMGIAAGWVMACGAGGSAAWFQQAASKANTGLEQCEADLDVERGRSGAIEDQSIPGLTGAILNDRTRWEETLSGDDAFRQAYYTEYKKYATSDKIKRLEPVIDGRSRSFIGFKRALESSQLPANLARIMAFLAAPENAVEGREWSLVQDSTGERACGRGPAQLTYRQGKNLGIVPLQVNALVDQFVAVGSDLAEKKAALQKMGGAGLEFAEDEVATAEVGAQGEKQCLHIAGEDARTDARAVASLLGTRFGPNAPRLPEENDQYWQLARIMSFYASDAGYGYDRLSFPSSTAPSVVLDDMTPSEKEYVLKESASLVARTVAVYCSAALGSEEPPEHLPDIPGWADCLILDWLVKQET
ncbi:MAG: hypothetical protein EP330_07480 [Deltaproteobacteria bacterium]|nr:MAG: hypothetical protein EP330_07480 [Deltaproteobacteria bacterium]